MVYCYLPRRKGCRNNAEYQTVQTGDHLMRWLLAALAQLWTNCPLRYLLLFKVFCLSWLKQNVKKSAKRTRLSSLPFLFEWTICPLKSKAAQRLILIRMIYKQQRIADWEIKTGHRTDQFILCGVFIYQNVLKYPDTYFESPVSAEYLRR